MSVDIAVYHGPTVDVDVVDDADDGKRESQTASAMSACETTDVVGSNPNNLNMVRPSIPL